MDYLRRVDRALSTFEVCPKNAYLLIIRNRFDVITKLLEEGATFPKLFNHFAEHNVLPESGSPERLRQLYKIEALERMRKTKDYDKPNTSVPATKQAEEKTDVDEVKRKFE